MQTTGFDTIKKALNAQENLAGVDFTIFVPKYTAMVRFLISLAT